MERLGPHMHGHTSWLTLPLNPESHPEVERVVIPWLPFQQRWGWLSLTDSQTWRGLFPRVLSSSPTSHTRNLLSIYSTGESLGETWTVVRPHPEIPAHSCCL